LPIVKRAVFAQPVDLRAIETICRVILPLFREFNPARYCGQFWIPIQLEFAVKSVHSPVGVRYAKNVSTVWRKFAAGKIAE
jgi:hypothetical protein